MPLALGRCAHRLFGFSRAGQQHRANPFLSRRVEDGEFCAALRSGPFAVDQAMATQQRGMLEFHVFPLFGQRLGQHRQRRVELRLRDGGRIEEADDIAAGQQHQAGFQRTRLYAICHSHWVITRSGKPMWLKGVAVIDVGIYRRFHRHDRKPRDGL